MKIVDVREAKTQLSQLVDQLRGGEEAEIVIAIHGKPAARLLPYASRRTLGVDEGLVTVSADFDASDSQVANLFKGKS